MIIALTGFMGSGKSSVGKALALKLCCPFSDLDDCVQQRCGKTVSEIFAEQGEEGFRREELEALREELSRLGQFPLSVLALGGGNQCIPQAQELLREKTFLVYLKADLPTILERLKDATDRPLLGPDVATLYEQRQKIYESADLTVTSEGKIEKNP